VARRDKAADRLRGLDHVQHTDPIVRPHIGFWRYGRSRHGSGG
jgi:hypothetical protein